MKHAGPTPPESSIDDPATEVAALVYTGGTTGLSKGAMLSHANFLADTWMLAELLPVGRGDVLGMVLPLFHVNAQVVTTMVPLLIGGLVFTLMITWKEGRRLMGEAQHADAIDLKSFLGSVFMSPPARVDDVERAVGFVADVDAAAVGRHRCAVADFDPVDDPDDLVGRRIDAADRLGDFRGEIDLAAGLRHAVRATKSAQIDGSERLEVHDVAHRERVEPAAPGSVV